MKHVLQVVVIVAFLVLTLTGGISINRFRSSLNSNKTARIVGQIKQASQQFFLQHPQLDVKQP